MRLGFCLVYGGTAFRADGLLRDGDIQIFPLLGLPLLS